MKNIFLTLGAATMLVTSGCSEDFEIAAPGKNITVVYSMLNKGDTAHYIRIQKAFLDENKSAIDMSKISDSSFYKDLTVRMLEYQMKGTESFNESDIQQFIGETVLDKVDLAAEGYQKNPASNEQGFFTGPNYAYKFKKALSSKNGYRLIIRNNQTGQSDSSQLIGVVENDSLDFNVRSFADSRNDIDFSIQLDNSTYTLQFQRPTNGYTFEAVMRFHYVDKNIVTNVQTDKYLDYAFDVESGSTAKTLRFETPTKNFYSFLADGIGAAPANIERYMDSCDIFVYGANRTFYEYQQITLAQTGGLTGDQIKPTYTNMKGYNAIGVVASRAQRVGYKIPLRATTVEALKNNQLTAPLNIKGVSDH